MVPGKVAPPHVQSVEHKRTQKGECNKGHAGTDIAGKYATATEWTAIGVRP